MSDTKPVSTEPLPGERILLEGIELPAQLGVSAAERRMRRPVRLDLDLGFDLQRSGRSDDLRHTIDYQAIHDVVAEVVQGREHTLVEALAERIASALFDAFALDEVTITVHKPKPIAGVLHYAGIRVTRRR